MGPGGGGNEQTGIGRNTDAGNQHFPGGIGFFAGGFVEPNPVEVGTAPAIGIVNAAVEYFGAGIEEPPLFGFVLFDQMLPGTPIGEFLKGGFDEVLVIGAEDGAVIPGLDAFNGLHASGSGFAGAETAEESFVTGRAGVKVSYCRGVGAVGFPSLAVRQIPNLRPGFRSPAGGSLAEFGQDGYFLLDGQVVEAL